MTEILNKLILNGETISLLESCTGGYIASCITDNEGCSKAFKASVVTYSNEDKIKYGVDPLVISKYTVYSKEVAKEMAKAATSFPASNADYGIGITGTINRVDLNNEEASDNNIYIAVYSLKKDSYFVSVIEAVSDASRNENKQYVYTEVVNMLKQIIL